MYKRFFITAAIAALFLLILSSCGTPVAAQGDVLTVQAQNGNEMTYTVTRVDNSNNVLWGNALVILPEADVIGVQRLQSAKNDVGPQTQCSFSITYKLPDESVHEYVWGQFGCEKYEGWKLMLDEIETSS